MKISLSWVFDHIDENWHSLNISKLVKKFNETVAEIEQYHKVTIDCKQLTVVHIIAHHGETVDVYSEEWGVTIMLPFRPDLNDKKLFLVKKVQQKYQWGTTIDVGGAKEMLIPPLFVNKNEVNGAWKRSFEKEDWILEFDNKSITHRPDLWCHRGIAREIAALLSLPFKPIDNFIATNEIKQYAIDDSVKRDEYPFAVAIKDKMVCKRFAGVYIEYVEPRASLLWMMLRLSRIDCRSIDMIVDITNYCMFDISQPLHAFDAAAIESRSILVRMAYNKEKLTLLDGESLDLSSDDLVITDGTSPIALAGVMGGITTAVSPQTQSLFVEAAYFDATTIRRSANRYKIRTESSTRFEKSLDSNQNTVGILRFIKLLSDSGSSMKLTHSLVSLGEPVAKQTILVDHTFIEKRIGTTIAVNFVEETLIKLGFGIAKKVKEDRVSYCITIPTYRGTKDISIREDIVEEVGRFFGYSSIPKKAPIRKMISFDLSHMMRLRRIKWTMAYGLAMHEVQNYALYSEDFLRKMRWDPEGAVQVKSPISINWRRLATSLIPNLMRAIVGQVIDCDEMRFFEWGRVWHTKDGVINEQKQLSGIIYRYGADIDFYKEKADLDRLFVALKLDVVWIKAEESLYPWYCPSRTAYLMHNGEKVGIAGKINKLFFRHIVNGDAFLFEMNGDFLLDYQTKIPRYQSLDKFPSISRDFSMMVPSHLTVADLSVHVSSIDNRIRSIQLIDMFQKPEWKERKSLTVRFLIRDREKTLTKEEADKIEKLIIVHLSEMGVTIR